MEFSICVGASFHLLYMLLQLLILIYGADDDVTSIRWTHLNICSIALFVLYRMVMIWIFFASSSLFFGILEILIQDFVFYRLEDIKLVQKEQTLTFEVPMHA